MKRKGLVVSSIIMVVVLIASLTTATYAWFSATSSALIKDVTLKTQASKGLSIAAYRYNTDHEYYSGALRVDANKWIGDDTQFGATLSFSSTEVDDGFLSASGDGINMFTGYGGDNNLEENASDAYNGSSPKFLGIATENKSYFAADVAVQLNQAIAQKTALILEQFTIKAEGTYMGAATRVAIFAYDGKLDANTNPGDGFVPTTSSNKATCLSSLDSSNAIVVVEPFGKMQKLNTTWNNERSVFENNNVIDRVGDYGADGATAKQGNPLTTTYDKKYIQDDTTLTSGATIDVNNKAANVTQIAKSTSQASSTDKIRAGAFTAQGQVAFFRIVVWFEGEDSECVPLNANGSGVTLTIEFGLGAVE